MLQDESFQKREQQSFIKDIVPNRAIDMNRKSLIELQFKDINTALLQQDESILKKVKKFLDFTLFEF